MTNPRAERQDVMSALRSLPERNQRLIERILGHRFISQQAKQMATFGLARRLGIIVRTAQNVFDIAPYGNRKQVSRESRQDLEINIQAHVFNTFGATDNLAWIWVHEVLGEEANNIPAKLVGIRRANTRVLGTLPPAMAARLTELEPWFEYLEAYRHSLAHRIPLYVAPYVLTGETGRDIEKAIADAETPQELRAAYDRSDSEGVFVPIFALGTVGSPAPVRFDGQLLADFATIEDLTVRFFDALADRQSGS